MISTTITPSAAPPSPADAPAAHQRRAPRVPLTPGSEIVVVQRLEKTFRDFWMRARVKAVDDVSFEIFRGEVFGLLGPNGSGKSTTIKILLGLLHKSKGRVSMFAKPPTDVAVKKRIGYLPEESYLYPFLNARETLEYYAKLFGLDADVRARRIDELLDMVGLTAVQFRPVHEYSKGMQRRIGIAQALINDPELLILDEPTTGLDPIGTRQIKDLILQLARRGKTVLLSSHLLADVEDCVDRMVILYGGKIQASGTCDELLEASDRSIIETERLDPATIARIEQVIRESSHGKSSISRVSHPRQRLEDLFVQIVERARAANVSTAGAQHGGQTAAFLREGEEGAAIIEQLVAFGDAPNAPDTPTSAPTAPASNQPDRDLLSNLLGGGATQSSAPARGPQPASAKPAPPAPSANPTPAPAGPPADVDRGLIGSLLDTPDTQGRKHAP